MTKIQKSIKMYEAGMKRIVAEKQKQKQEMEELKLKNHIKKIAKEIVSEIPRYQLKTNKSDVFQSSRDIPAPGESIWAPWSPIYKGK